MYKERQILNSCYRYKKLAKTGLYAIMNELPFLASVINERKVRYVFKLSKKASGHIYMRYETPVSLAPLM